MGESEETGQRSLYVFYLETRALAGNCHKMTLIVIDGLAFYFVCAHFQDDGGYGNSVKSLDAETHTLFIHQSGT